MFVFTLTMLLLFEWSWAGSCREAQLCCRSRDSSCVVQNSHRNAIIEEISDKPCYCDHACMKLGDCCEDFKKYCGVLNCKVSNWSQWTECDKNCGIGLMMRTRTILQQAQNGGKQCPTLLQTHSCQGFLCHHNNKILREMALLVTPTLIENDNIIYNNIPDNLGPRFHDSYKTAHIEYCVEFEVLKATKSCHKLPPYNLLYEGERIIVRCDFADLLPGSSTKLNANSLNKINSSTFSNRFKQPFTKKERKHIISKIEEYNHINHSAIDEGNMSLHISNNGNLMSKNTKYDKMASYRDTAHLLAESPTKKTMKKLNRIKYHCRGEGLPGRSSPWIVLSEPSCHGKWLRLSVGQTKNCKTSQFRFI